MFDLEYIRRAYNVPARKGQRVRFTWSGSECGTIVGARNGRLLVRMDSDGRLATLHPTFCVEYLPKEEK